MLCGTRLLCLAALCGVALGLVAPKQSGLATQTRPRDVRVHIFGGDDPEKPKLTRDTEPEQYFASDFEDAPIADKMKDPALLIGLGSIFFPFVLLGICYQAGLIG
ncbi:hypothetical protein M885DRAFT_512814 [Pelagophyceae sp. CCMP2097]|nr:hypothetical protein M885DRAFT_512814 [Pelagophyceae sp. CCMP2097]|mmetsp:Transcript_15852/g.53414  ORF Transcript_15852/g.53414 Transcript_15852/m.53414 type:complete len:105 (-) Transcript_15852:93-407(-)